MAAVVDTRETNNGTDAIVVGGAGEVVEGNTEVGKRESVWK